MTRRGARGHTTKRNDETIHTTTWMTHHKTPQRSTTQHSTSWRSATDATLPGHREHTGGSRQDTHGTPVLTTVRRPWVAQPHEHAHTTQVTDTSCEYGWLRSKGARHRGMVAEQGCRSPRHGGGAPRHGSGAELRTTADNDGAHLGRSTHLTSKTRTTTTALATRSRRETLDLEHHVLRERCEKHGSDRVLSAWKTRLEQLTGSHTSIGKDSGS